MIRFKSQYTLNFSHCVCSIAETKQSVYFWKCDIAVTLKTNVEKERHIFQINWKSFPEHTTPDVNNILFNWKTLIKEILYSSVLTIISTETCLHKWLIIQWSIVMSQFSVINVVHLQAISVMEAKLIHLQLCFISYT